MFKKIMVLVGLLTLLSGCVEDEKELAAQPSALKVEVPSPSPKPLKNEHRPLKRYTINGEIHDTHCTTPMPIRNLELHFRCQNQTKKHELTKNVAITTKTFSLVQELEEGEGYIVELYNQSTGKSVASTKATASSDPLELVFKIICRE